ncbi:MAG: hypothetical protein Q9170_002026 [Blastenia crenularia]
MSTATGASQPPRRISYSKGNTTTYPSLVPNHKEFNVLTSTPPITWDNGAQTFEPRDVAMMIVADIEKASYNDIANALWFSHHYDPNHHIGWYFLSGPMRQIDAEDVEQSLKEIRKTQLYAFLKGEHNILRLERDDRQLITELRVMYLRSTDRFKRFVEDTW